MNCKSCGAPIIWVRTTTGASMPVDASPADNGNLKLVPGLHGPIAHVVDRGTHVAHFVTCPNAKKHRKHP
jgi:hypothetical protein